MYTTSINRTLTLAGFGPAGKPGCTNRGQKPCYLRNSMEAAVAGRWLRIAGGTLLMALTIFAPPGTAQTDGPAFTTIYNFTGAPSGCGTTGQAACDGATPLARVLTGANGALYGTTQQGGTAINGGTVFELKPPASPGADWTETVIYSFPAVSFPEAALAAGPNGELYGTTYYGGGAGVGAVFELAPPASPGGSWTETTLYSFSAPSGDPQNPSAGVAIGKDGVLYGTTQYGGVSANCFYYGCGSVYSLTPPASPGGAWTEDTLYNFMGGSDGAAVLTGVVIGEKGALYGTTISGGPNSSCRGYFVSGCGTVFKLTPPASAGGSWTETVLYSFTGGSDGGFPSAVVDEGGVLYGITSLGGDLADCGGFGCGSVFEMSPPTFSGGAWTETVLYGFTGVPNGLYPSSSTSGSGLVIGVNGVLYGTTANGGSSRNCPEDPGCGTVFELTPPAAPGEAWTEALLHSFTSSDGFRPSTGPVIGQNGALYGTTPYGGTSTTCAGGCGTVYKLTP